MARRSAAAPNPEVGLEAQTLDRLGEMVAEAFPGRGLEAAELVRGGLANHTFKVRVAGSAEPLAVRVYVRDPTAAQREASILALVERTLPVPQVLHVSAGRCGAPAFVILSWVDGESLEEVLNTSACRDARAAARATGEVLAKLQRFRFAEPGFFGPTLEIHTPFSSAPQAIVGIVGRCLFQDGADVRLGSALSDRLWRFVLEHERSLGALDHHAMLVHGDFSVANVIVRVADGTPRVAAVIDWEYAHAGTPMVDLGAMLRACRPDAAPWFEYELIGGYVAEQGILPHDWRSLSRLADLVKLCAFARAPNLSDVAVQGVRRAVETVLTDACR
ncbi:MAG TPA: phosphotransferase [Dehalococcoidia bacterium]|nr:phosphotransferase [Dehalococcoidia bacterium]